jgi:Tol biopolymer transport system component
MKASLSPFDKTMVAILGVVALAIGIIISRGDQVGVLITQTFPINGGEISAPGKIGIQFNQAMQNQSVESLIKIEPDVPGHAVWQGNTMWFVFDHFLQQGTAYQFDLLAGGIAQDGRRVLKSQVINFNVRKPDVVYLSTLDNQNDLWIISSDGGSSHQLTNSGGKVFDFAPSRDGEQIVYSATISENGMDLWLMLRDGSQAKKLVDCGLDHCSQQAWSPDGAEIIYHRAVPMESHQNTISGIWGVDPISGQTDFLISGEQPAWSPDGNWIAVMDSQAGVIRVLNVQTGKGIEVNASTDFLPEWLPNSSRMAYANLQAAGALETVALFQVDVTSNQVSRLLDTLPGNLELSMPIFSPDSKKFVIAMRSFTGGLSKQLWYMPPGGTNLQQITKDETFSNAHYSWNQSGTELIFQRVQMGVANSSPQVIIWDIARGSSTVLASNAALPEWLP